MIAERAAAAPSAPALCDGHHGTVTNSDLDRLVGLATSRLAALGVREGDVVAVRLPNRVELVVAISPPGGSGRP